VTTTDRNFKQENADHLSQDSKNKVMAFVEADKAFQARLEKFFADNPEALLEIDNLRELRNRALDDAEQNIRRDATLANYDKVTKIEFGPFSVQKKKSEWFIPETFVSLAERSGNYKALLDGGAIRIKTEIDFDLATAFLKLHSLDKTFVAAKDAKELTPAISGPKIVPPLGAQLKKKQ
jgi:hypothetical protein